MSVSALRRRGPGGEDDGVRVLVGEEGLHELLRGSDVVVVTAPFTPATAGMIGREELAMMRPGAHLVVISRGGIVDEGALIDALRSGRLGGAGLDAHAVEPLPPERSSPRTTGRPRGPPRHADGRSCSRTSAAGATVRTW
jgi:phosphoglycerate dehydrogenase-like enzyme